MVGIVIDSGHSMTAKLAAIVRYVRKNKRATLPQVTEKLLKLCWWHMVARHFTKTTLHCIFLCQLFTHTKSRPVLHLV